MPATPGPPPEDRIRVKGDWQALIGRTISAVMVGGRASGSPAKYVYLVFDDDTHFEIYSCGGDLAGNGRVYLGGLLDVLRYVRSDAVPTVYARVGLDD